MTYGMRGMRDEGMRVWKMEYLRDVRLCVSTSRSISRNAVTPRDVRTAPLERLPLAVPLRLIPLPTAQLSPVASAPIDLWLVAA